MNKYMVIELRGVEFHNKGAELMLLAILAQLKNEIPDVIFVMETSRSVSVNQKANSGIWNKFKLVKRGIDFSFLGDFIPKIIRNSKKIILDSEIKVVLDGSGFAYGDIWGAKKARNRTSSHILKWKRQGKKVILLPQAFGPFDDLELRKEMEVIIRYADLLFARDKFSYKYMEDIQGDKSRSIFLKPDFTNLFNGAVPDYFQNRKKQAAVIPNYKMVETNIFESEEEYIDLLAHTAQVLKNKGLTPFFLNHEGKRDLQLINKVVEKLAFDIEVIDEASAVNIKGIIGASDFVITSRFHGLVSALSQAVPCLCMGWSHKYEALVEDYNFKEALIIDSDMNSKGVEAKIDEILNNSLTIIEKLKIASLDQKESSRDMWAKVLEIIKS